MSKLNQAVTRLQGTTFDASGYYAELLRKCRNCQLVTTDRVRKVKKMQSEQSEMIRKSRSKLRDIIDRIDCDIIFDNMFGDEFS